MVKFNNPPAHLEASSPEQLRALMFANNTRHKRRFHYFDFSFAKGKWHCWFEISIKDEIGVKKEESK